MDVRPAEVGELDQIAKLWYDGWQDAHATIVPPELAALRTLTSFRNRLEKGLGKVRVTGPLGEPRGFYMLKHDELDQFFVAAHARGSGVAATLLLDAETRLVEGGVQTAWLACAIGNERAARFYEKHGWCRVGTMVHHAEAPNGTYALETWRYEKSLTRSA